MNPTDDLKIKTIVETDNFTIWQADEPDDESTFHLELNNVTIHFFNEEWDEFVELAKRLVKQINS
jgi:hypothetical protein